MSTATVEAHIRWEANPGKVGTLVSLRLRKDLEGRRVGSQGRAERVRRRRRSGWSRDHESRLGLKALLLSNARTSRKTQPPEAPRLPWARPQRENVIAARREVRCASKSQKYGDVKNTRDVSCTLCIRSAGSRPRPREKGERRRRGASSPPRALQAAGGGTQSAGGAGRGKRGKGPGGRPRGSSKPQVRSFPQLPPTFIAASPPAGRGRA